jgi:hypothetical protein
MQSRSGCHEDGKTNCKTVQNKLDQKVFEVDAGECKEELSLEILAAASQTSEDISSFPHHKNPAPKPSQLSGKRSTWATRHSASMCSSGPDVGESQRRLLGAIE